MNNSMWFRRFAIYASAGMCWLALPAWAQQQNFAFPNIAGVAIATEYGRWTAVIKDPVAPGTSTVEMEPASDAPGNAPVPFQVNQAVLAQDGSHSEVILPSAISCPTSTGNCQITATFQFAHPGGVVLVSATGGIQEAIDALSAQRGGRVWIPQGIYNLAATVKVPLGVQLIGAGRTSTTLREADNANLAVAVQVQSGAIGVTLRGWTLDLNAAHNTGPNQQYGIELQSGVTEATLQDLGVKDFYGLVGSSGVGISIDNGSDILVENCRLENLGNIAELRQSDGIYSSGDRIRIIGNMIISATDTSIVAESSIDPVIADNTIENPVQGIAIDSAIAGTSTAGGVVSANIISGLTRYNGQGILVWRGAGQSTQSVAVTGNVLHDFLNGAGIFVNGASNVSLTGNVLTNMHGTASGPNDGLGVVVKDANQITMTGNQIISCAGSGLVLEGVTQFLIEGNLLKNNSTFSPASAPGIAVQDGTAPSSNGWIENNVSTGSSQGRGLTISATTQSVTLIGNDLRGNANSPGLYADGAGVAEADNQLMDAGAEFATDNLTISNKLEIPLGGMLQTDMLDGSHGGILARNDQLQLSGGTGGGSIQNTSGTSSLLQWTDTGTFSINGDAGFSSAPRMVLSAFFPGTLASTWTAANWLADRSIVVTRIQAALRTAPSGCTTNAVVQLSDGTHPLSLEIAGGTADSGPLDQIYGAGSNLGVFLSVAAGGCVVAPADMNIEISYRMN